MSEMLDYDVGLSYRSEFSDDSINEFIKLMSSSSLRLAVAERKEIGVYAGYEWLMPTAVIVFIFKSYFDGFLNEMGKEHYHLLKNSLKSLTRRLFRPSGPRAMIVTSGKINKHDEYSFVYSVMADVGGNKKVKLLMQQDVSQQECDEIIESFIDFINNLYNRTADFKILDELEKGRGILLVAFNRKTKTIERVVM